MEKTRTEHSARNTVAAVISRMMAILMGFAVRIVFTHTLSETYVGVCGLFSNIIMVLALPELDIVTVLPDLPEEENTPAPVAETPAPRAVQAPPVEEPPVPESEDLLPEPQQESMHALSALPQEPEQMGMAPSTAARYGDRKSRPGYREVYHDVFRRLGNPERFPQDSAQRHFSAGRADRALLFAACGLYTGGRTVH